MDELEKMENIRQDFMADDTPVTAEEWGELLEVGQRLQEEDTELNLYELYHYPDARAKLFEQISEAALQITNQHFTPEEMQAIKKSFVDYFEDKFNSILKKQIAKTDKSKVEKFLEFARAENPSLTAEQKTDLIKALVVGGLVEGG